MMRSSGIRWVVRSVAIAAFALAALAPAGGAGAVTGAGAVWNWGANNYGQLGDGSSTAHLNPKALPGNLSILQLEGGREHALARTASGDVYAWGWNKYGQVGNGSSAGTIKSPAKVMSGASDIGAGHYSSFAVKSGAVWAWGRNDTGQLGDGSKTNRRSPVQVSGLSGLTIVQVAGGRNHAMALSDDGHVYTWGSNQYGQLGDGTSTSTTSAHVVPGLTGIVEIFAGRDHNLALGSGGQIWAWGRNQSGQLGDGTKTSRRSPVRVTTGANVFLSNVVAIGAGADHSLALTSGGDVYAWGANSWGQVGDGSTTARTRAVHLSLSNIVAIAGGRQSSIALTQGGDVYTWGDNRQGQLGHGSITSTGRTTPWHIDGLSGVSAVGLGMDYGMVVIAS